jgi:hypothetical protein
LTVVSQFARYQEKQQQRLQNHVNKSDLEILVPPVVSGVLTYGGIPSLLLPLATSSFVLLLLAAAAAAASAAITLDDPAAAAASLSLSDGQEDVRRESDLGRPKLMWEKTFASLHNSFCYPTISCQD